MTENNKFDELVEKADAGDTKAMIELANTLKDADDPECLKWYEKLHEQGELSATFEIATLYYWGEIINQDYEKALEYFLLSEKDERDFADQAEYMLFLMYSEGQGTSENPEEAFRWLSKLCDKGKTGDWYACVYAFMGDHLLLERNKEKLKSLQYLQSVLLGDTNVKPESERDIESPYPWYRKAADQGHFEAMYKLSNGFFEDDYTDITEAEALEWMKKASDGGVADAKIFLANRYGEKDCSSEEHEKARALYRDLLENHEAYEIEGEKYKDLLHKAEKLAAIMENLDDAFRWNTMLAEQNDPSGIYMLALCYLYGWGTAPSFQTSQAIADRLEPLDPELHSLLIEKTLEAIEVGIDKQLNEPLKKSGGCYVATAVYGSYDCPEVWTLRRFRDYTLAETWYGRVFIKVYYAVSPTLVKWFGKTAWFKKLWKGRLDHLVEKLRAGGVEDTPYADRDYH